MGKISSAALATLVSISKGDIHQISYDFKRGRLRDSGKSSRSIASLFFLGYIELDYKVNKPQVGTWYKVKVTKSGMAKLNSTNC